MLFKEYAGEWLRAQEPKVKRLTLKIYDGLLKRHLKIKRNPAADMEKHNTKSVEDFFQYVSCQAKKDNFDME